MKIRKYEANTEQEAMSKVKEDLGKDAVILNIRTIHPRGFLGFFKKPHVEITAVYEEKNVLAQTKAATSQPAEKPADPTLQISRHSDIVKDFKIQEQQVKISNLEEKLNVTEELLKKYIEKLDAPKEAFGEAQGKAKYSNSVLRLIYNSLEQNGVSEDVINTLLQNAEEFINDNKTDINMLVKMVYNRIIKILGVPVPIVIDNKDQKANVVILMGPTGVGKTTTIAKLSSYFMLAKQKRVGLITADTYRIAAVEQLRTYADILGIDVNVVYTPEDISKCIDKARRNNDIVFVDTAGRSHRNNENIKDLEKILLEIPYSEKYLVLSTTTKYDDLQSIISVYSDISDYRIIFTKLDETTNVGSLLNVCHLTGKPLSYITDGQDVPDDIKIVQPEMIAKSLLGSTDV